MITNSKRTGYAMLLVLVLNALLLGIYGVAFRHLSAAIRVESARAHSYRRDEGSLKAVTQAMILLETGLPPSDPYECETIINTSTGPRGITVVFDSEGPGLWEVTAAPTVPPSSPPPMPLTFAGP